MTRRLVARERARTASPSNGATAVQRVCEGVYQGFCRWFGPSGSDALFLRALAHVRPAHPALADLRLRARPETGLEGIDESVQRHGATAIDAALEALLVDVLELLGRLIGDDMTQRLMERALLGASDHRGGEMTTATSEGERGRDE